MTKEKVNNGYLRPPIVTVLGHVDHGKTSLLDVLRETNEAGKEAGGITQGIGASVIETKEGNKITFIDTPGHAAFFAMRSRGAKAADIALLVVAADEGLKPQTKEALEYILQEKIPFIVVATKMDVAGAKKETIQGQLENEGVLFEGRGGDVPLVAVSAKEKQGLDELLEMIILVAEVNEIGKENGDLQAVVIETNKVKAGPRVSVVIEKGEIKVGDQVYADGKEAKVRGLFDHAGKSVKKMTPGFPVQILGFSDLPSMGARLIPFESKEKLPAKKNTKNVTKSEESELSVVIKAENTGSLEAIISNLPKSVQVVSSGVGEVTETDVFMAKSAEQSLILVFESKIPTSVKKLAEAEDVEIDSFDIIYELFDKVKEIIESGKVKVLGQAKIVDSFPFNNKKVAGCKVSKGKIGRQDTVILKRGDEDLGEAKVVSIRKEKEDVGSVGEGEECGIIFTPQLEFNKGDMLLSVRKP